MAFKIQNALYTNVNDGLEAELGKMDGIMDDLNSTLSRIDQASEGKATPLWRDQQTSWNNSYEEMKGLLRVHVTSSKNVHETFNDGDNRGVRAMS
jgi:uncharacterized protein YukE